MSEVFSSDNYRISLDAAIEEYKQAAGIVSEEQLAIPVSPEAKESVLDGISLDLKLLAGLYFKGVVSYEEVAAPDRLATINKIRKEGRI